jgi:hypothetical protein
MWIKSLVRAPMEPVSSIRVQRLALLSPQRLIQEPPSRIPALTRRSLTAGVLVSM